MKDDPTEERTGHTNPVGFGSKQPQPCGLELGILCSAVPELPITHAQCHLQQAFKIQEGKKAWIQACLVSQELFKVTASESYGST